MQNRKMCCDQAATDRSGMQRRLGSWTEMENARMFELLSLQTTNICTSQSHIFHQWGLNDRALSQNISLWYTYPLLIGWFIQQWWGDLPSIRVSTRMSVIHLQISPCQAGVSYPGRSQTLKLYLTPIQNGSYIQNGFGLVPSYTRHC